MVTILKLCCCCCCSKNEDAEAADGFSLNVDIECRNITCCTPPAAPTTILQRLPSEFLRRCKFPGKGKRSPEEGSESVAKESMGLHTAQTGEETEISPQKIHGSQDGYAVAGGSGGNATLCTAQQWVTLHADGD